MDLGVVCNEYDYLSSYESNIDKMKEEAEKLADLKASVEVAVEAAERNLERIRIDVTYWMEQADDILKKVSEYDKVWRIDLLYPDETERYSRSKWAVKVIQDIAKLHHEGQFTCISYPVHRAIDTTSSEGLNSRKRLRQDIIEALKDDSVQLVGLCGLGGVGKTSMAQEIWHKAEQKDELHFDEVVFVEVPRASDTGSVQQRVADGFGLQLEENDDFFMRASALKAHLKRSKNVLLILDGVWEQLDLKELGIPSEASEENKSCKVFFTSRNLDACKQMKPQKVFDILELPPDEAWNLFVHESKESFAPDHDLYQVARNIVERCQGLPLCVVTIARLLRGENDKDTWQDMLERLKSGDLDDGEYSTVYKILGECYINIKSDETKRVFLLCCLFPEDEEIAIEDLLRFGIGLNIFEKSNTVNNARIRTYSCVNKLKNRHLLYGGSVKGFVKMHDLVRDTGLNIASTGENVFVVRHGDDLLRWPEEPKPECCTSISLRCRKMPQLPGGLRYPQLELLQLIGFSQPLMFPTNFLEGMGELKILNLKQMLIQSYPFEVSKELRNLSLDFCTFPIGVPSSIGDLGALTILTFAFSDIEILPQEIGKLTQLRVLDLTECGDLRTIAPGVLESLIRLEELYMSGCYNLNKECVRELSSLSHLAALEIEGHSMSRPLSYVDYGKLTRFRICVGHAMDSNVFENTLKLSDITFREERIEDLFSKAEILHLRCCRFATRLCLNKSEAEDFSKLMALNLDYCRGLVYLVQRYEQEPNNVFQTLESLFLCDMRNLEGIFGFKREEIRELNGPVLLPSFQNLRDLEIWHCPRLKRLFWISKGLMKLEKLKIVSCFSMEAIFWIESRGEEEENAVMNFEFPQLKCLFLVGLPHVTEFCKGVHSVMLPQLIELRLENVPKLTIPHLKLAYSDQRFLNGKIMLTSQLEELSVGSMQLKEVQIDEHLDTGVLNLRHMSLTNCDGLATVASSHVIRKLMFLEVIQICGCPTVEVVFDLEGVIVEEAPTTAVMDSLTKLELAYLPRMTHVWKHLSKGFEGFKNLTVISLEDCDSLGPSLFSPLIVKLLVQLRHLSVRRCDKMEVIVKEDDEADPVATILPNKLELPRLFYLQLEELRILRCFCSEPRDFVWPSLEDVVISACPQLTTFTMGKSFTPSLKNIVDLNAAVEDQIKQSPGIALTNKTLIQGLTSRKRLRLEIIEALKDDSVQLVGLCGLGGAGKTTMAQEIRQKAEQKDRLHFDEVVFVTVSRASDTKRVQQSIADSLGLKLKENDDLFRRASALKTRLMLRGDVLLILDDVWEQLDLKQLGITFEVCEENKRCKVFFTSRNLDTCNQMKSQKVFEISMLPWNEAWNLFQQESNRYFAPDDDLYQVARYIVQRCQGLLLCIVTVAKLLHGENDMYRWLDILVRLETSNLDDHYKNVYKILAESYNSIESYEAQRVFLLCCLFPEDEEIAIEDLLRFGTGLNIFKISMTLDILRDRTYSCVKMLKNRHLLDGGSVDGFVKMHDLVRDTGLNIASTGENVFVVRHGVEVVRWPRVPECCTSISLRYHEMLQIPHGLRCPKLELLQLIGFHQPLMFPTNFFEGLGKLKVLILKRMQIQSYPFEVSNELRSLSLVSCRFPGSAPPSIRNLKALTILTFAYSDIQILPQEIGELTRLRVLDLTECGDLRTIVPGVLESLIRLEELYMRGCYQLNKECLEELSSFSHLDALEIDGLSNYLDIDYSKLMRFRICVGHAMDSKVFENTLKLSDETFREEGIEVLFSRAEILHLSNCRFEYRSCLNKSDKEDFSKLRLRALKLYRCDNLKNVVQKNGRELSNVLRALESMDLREMHDLEDIFGGFFECGEIRGRNGPVPLPSFQNLRHLEIWNCPRLKRLFPISKGLMKLEELKIASCVSMETIFWIERRGEEEEENAVMNVEFPELKRLVLVDLPNVTEIFEGGVHSVMLPRLIGLRLVGVPKLTFPNRKVLLTSQLEHLCVGRMHLRGVEIDEHLDREVLNLRHMSLTDCDGLDATVSSSHVIRKSMFLEVIQIWGCPTVEVVFDLEGVIVEEAPTTAVMDSLTKLELVYLPRMTHVWKHVPKGFEGFKNLTKITLYDCDSLGPSLFSPLIVKLLVQLRHLWLSGCDKMEVIVKEDNEADPVATELPHTLGFPSLISLRLEGLEILRCFCSEPCDFEWLSLESVEIEDCPKLTTFTVGKSFTPSLMNIVDLNSAVEEHIKQSPGIAFKISESISGESTQFNLFLDGLT